MDQVQQANLQVADEGITHHRHQKVNEIQEPTLPTRRLLILRLTLIEKLKDKLGGTKKY